MQETIMRQSYHALGLISAGTIKAPKQYLLCTKIFVEPFSNL